jgi:hypothetical protein
MITNRRRIGGLLRAGRQDVDGGRLEERAAGAWEDATALALHLSGRFVSTAAPAMRHLSVKAQWYVYALTARPALLRRWLLFDDVLGAV